MGGTTVSFYPRLLVWLSGLLDGRFFVYRLFIERARDKACATRDESGTFDCPNRLNDQFFNENDRETVGKWNVMRTCTFDMLIIEQKYSNVTLKVRGFQK